MKRASLDPRRWPLAFKAPALVAAFMLIVSIVMTNAVLSRLRETQERQLAAMSTITPPGLAIDSMKIALVFGVTARAKLSTSSESAQITFQPKLL